MNNSANPLKQSFRDKDYRHGYVDEFLNACIATQIKVLREQRGWSQKELACQAEMKQPRISVMENVNYSSWSIKILRKLAEAFDLTLRVSFESFSTRVADIDKFSRKNLERCSFEDDPYFHEEIDQQFDIKNVIVAPPQPGHPSDDIYKLFPAPKSEERKGQIQIIRLERFLSSKQPKAAIGGV